MMLWGGRWEGVSCLGMHVRIKDFKIKKIKKIKKECGKERFDTHKRGSGSMTTEAEIAVMGP